MTPDFLPYGTGDAAYPMNNIPYVLGTIDDLPYNAFGNIGEGWALHYSKYSVCTCITVIYVYIYFFILYFFKSDMYIHIWPIYMLYNI